MGLPAQNYFHIALCKPNDGLHQIWMKNFVAYEADQDMVFPEPPDAKAIADVVATGILPKGIDIYGFRMQMHGDAESQAGSQTKGS